MLRMQLSVLVGFYSLLVLASILLLLAVVSARRYLSKRIPEDGRATLVVLVAGLLILSMDMVLVYPEVDYDAVGLSISFHTNATSIVLPCPEDPGLVARLPSTVERADLAVVETERGRGLRFDMKESGWVSLDISFSTRGRNVDYMPDLIQDGQFLVYVEPGPSHKYLEIHEFRIIHQDPYDFRSFQIIVDNFQSGWTAVEYEIDRGEGQLSDG